MRRLASPWIFEKVRRTMTLRPSRTNCSVSGGLIDVLEIGLVESDHDMLRQRATKRSISSCVSKRPGRVVWIGDEDQARPRRDRGEHCIEVMPKIRARDFDRVRTEDRRDQFVGDESMLGRDDFIVAIAERRGRETR